MTVDTPPGRIVCGFRTRWQTALPKPRKYLDALPAWARELSEKYYSRSFALFVLYGNVRDLVPLRSAEAQQALFR